MTKDKQIKDFKDLISLVKFFDSEEKCLDYLAYQRWEDNPVCPFCNNQKVYSLKGENKRYKCALCRKQFSARVGTIFQDSRIELQKWFAAIYLVSAHKKGISSLQLSKDISVTQKTAWFMLQRIRFSLNQSNLDKLSDEVQADESFFDGKNKNRHKDKKVEGSQGRSFKDKTPVLGMLQKEKAQIVERPHKILPERTVKEKIVLSPAIVKCVVNVDTSEDSLKPSIESIVKHGSVIVTDEWKAYNNLRANYDHRIVDHTVKEYVNVNGDTTNAIEGFWAIFKRSYIGIYHYMSRKHLQKYADEMCFRYNTRHISSDNRFNLVLSNQNGKLSYIQLTNQ